MKSIYKTGRWVVLALLVVVILLLLKKPTSPAPVMGPVTTAEKSKSFEAKLEQIEAAQQQGQQAEEQHFDSQEANAFLQTATQEGLNQAMAKSAQAAAAAANQNPTAIPQTDTAEYSDVQAPQVAFENDTVVAQVVAKRYGQDIAVTVRGRLGSTPDGYVTFDPTEFKIGSLPVPVSLVNPELQKRLADPDIHAKLKLPAFIAALRVENGELVIVPR